MSSRAAEPSSSRPNQDIIELNDKGKYAEAEAAARRRLPEIEARHGADAPEVADLLDELVISLWRQGKVKEGEALKLAERAVRIREAHAADRPADVATSLVPLAHVREGLDDLAGARALYERAIAVREAAGGPDQPEIARLLASAGSMAAQLGDFAGARAALERSLRIKRKTLPPGDPSLAATLNNIAGLDVHMGDYPAARSGYEAALAIWEGAHGPEHPRVGDALHNLGNVMQLTGDYASALERYTRAVAVLRKSLGNEHPNLAHALQNYAEALRVTGQRAEARRALEESLAIQKKAFGPESPRPARVITNLSAVEIDEGRYAEARDHLKEAAALLESAYGAGNANLIPSLVGLADVLVRLGDFEEAGAVTARVRAIAAANLPADHPRLAFIDQIEARLRARAGDLEGARRLTGQALAARDARLGPWHPDTIASRGYLASLLWTLGERDPALDAARTAGVDLDRWVRETMRVLPEASALEMAARRTHPEEVLFTGLLDDPERRSAWLAACFDWTLRSRGFVLDEVVARRRIAALGETAGAREALARLGRASDRLAALWIKGADSGAATEFRTEIERAVRERDEAESALAAASAGYLKPRGAAAIDAARLAAAIPASSVLIEVVRAGVRPSVTRDGGAATSARYIALRLDRAGGLDFADLGDTVEVDRLIERWRSALSRSAEDEAPVSAARALEGAAASLSRKVWDPIARLAGAARRILFVPDGSLHLVHLPALTLPDGRFQVESGPAIHLLSSGRDLLKREDAGSAAAPPATLLALGGVEYSPGTAAAMRGAVRCPSVADETWAPLPGSRREVDSVRDMFGKRGETLALTGAAATESRLRSEAPRHEVLHLATHGYFLGEECGDRVPSPLLLSGLVLAGPWGGGRPAASDGLLTAEEAGALDLSGVRLAVLSGCSTGAGRVITGEGVLGLRRALEIAGARSLVMSLWPVPDREVRRWMTSFYATWLGGEAVFDAARRASLDRLEELERRDTFPHPYLWGGFVTAGDWR